VRLRLLALWTACSLLLAGATSGVAPGDVNKDGVYDIRDALLLMAYLRGEVELDAEQLAAADVAPIAITGPVAGDGAVNVGDLVVLLRHVAGEDVDGDFLSPEFELAHGLSPFVRDQDGNGIPDGLDDWDHDGLTNRAEELYGTDPFDPDTSGSGVLDGREAPAPALTLDVPTDVHAATAYLYTGLDPIQSGVDPQVIDPARVAVVRGEVRDEVRDEAGQPLPGVVVRVEGRPEYGATRTLLDGVFDLVVNGGERLTLLYEAPGFLRLRRRVAPPWLDYLTGPPVTLLAHDPGGTGTLSLPPPAGTAFAWQGSAVTDAAGTRRPTVIFQPGTTAEAIVEGEPAPIPLPQVTPRATETSKDVETQGMPAVPLDLAPGHDPIWVGELLVEEAEALGVAPRVVFANAELAEQPVVLYFEEYLSYPTGAEIERGVLDEEVGAWVPAVPGRVVAVTDIVAGVAELDTVGAAGTPLPPELEPTLAEREKLAELYGVGQKLARVPLQHFSFWCAHKTVAAPADARDPDSADPADPVPDEPCEKSGSILGCESQTLGEAVEVVGSPWQLHYTSRRTPGYRAAYQVEIPLTGESIPASLAEVGLEVQFAGRVQRFGPFPAAPDLVQLVEWPGTDAYERRPQGRQPIRATVRWIYPAANAIRPDGTPEPGALMRAKLGRSRTWTGFVGPWDNRAQGLGGWSLTPVHSYDARTRILYRGDGTQVSAEGLPSVIDTIHDGQLTFRNTGLALVPDGRAYSRQSHSDLPYGRVDRLELDGSITHIAGRSCVSGGCPLGDGGPAKDAWIRGRHLALAPDGSLYLSDQHRIRRIEAPITPDSIITTVVGTGSPAFGGDGGPASEALIRSPEGLLFAPDGSLYFSDSGNNRIRRVRPDGIIETVVGTGTGTCSFSVPRRALETPLPSSSHAVALGSDGSLFIASSGCHRLYRVTTDGRLDVFAGNGSSGAPEEGKPAKETSLPGPRGVAVSPDGSVYASTHTGGGTAHHRLHRIAPDGRISTVAGDGSGGSEGDGGPAAAARLNQPRAVRLDAAGHVYVADFQNRRVRRIEPPLPSYSAGEVFVPSSDGTEIYEFDGAGHHLRTLDALRTETKLTFAWDEHGLAGITDADGNVTTIERDAAGEATAIVGPYGHRTELTASADGWLTRIENPAGEAHVMVATEDGLLASLTTPRQHTTTFMYDADGRLLRDDDPAGGFQTLARTETEDGFEVAHETTLGRITTYAVARTEGGGQLRSVTDPAGLATSRTRDRKFETTTTQPSGMEAFARPEADPRLGFAAAFPALLEIRSPGGRLWSRSQARTASVDASGVLTEQTDEITVNGRASTVAWDALTPVPWAGGSPGLRTTTSPEGRVLEEALDARGRLVGARLGTLHPVHLAYDARGRLASLAQGAGGDVREVSFAYDPAGRLESVTDPLLRTVTFDYDAADRVTRQTLPDARFVDFTYDDAGNLTSLTPPGQPAHVFRYTALDQEEEYEPPAVSPADPRTFYTYDLDRSLTRVDRPGGTALVLAYDAAGRLESVSTPRGTTTQSYHPATGLIETITAPGGEGLAFAYDGSLLTSTTWSGTVSGSVSQSYDDDLRVVSQSVSGAFTEAFAYDDDGLLVAAGDLLLDRDPTTGLLTETTLGTVTTSQAYNDFGELAEDEAEVGATPLYANTYTRDGLGRITRKVETLQGTTTTFDYGYDLAGRLERVDVNETPARSYAYDPNGNRLSLTDHTQGGQVTSGSYDAQDRLLTYGSSTYTYTASGELASKVDSSLPPGQQTTLYTYDALGNLVQVELPDGREITYVIDGQNRRIGKKMDGVLERAWLYQDQLNPVAELDGVGAVVARFVYGSRPNVPDTMVKGGVTYRIVSDHLGSVRLVVDASTGAVAQRMDYDEWGQALLDTSPGFQPFGFAGGLYDPDTGFTRFGARDYDPELGRWTAKDPISYGSGSSNLYAYTHGDPVGTRDPNGLWAVNAVGATVGGISAAVGAHRQGASPGTVAAAFVLGAAVGGVFPHAATMRAAMAWGFLEGATGDIAGQLLANAVAGKRLHCIDLSSTVRSAFSGALGSGTGYGAGAALRAAGVAQPGAGAGSRAAAGAAAGAANIAAENVAPSAWQAFAESRRRGGHPWFTP
jgi:RHS repeat-associated protein